MYHRVLRDLNDEWVRVSWSLNEDFEAYLRRSRVDRVLLHDRLSVQIDRIYGEGEGGGPPSKEDRKNGF